MIQVAAIPPILNKSPAPHSGSTTVTNMLINLLMLYVLPPGINQYIMYIGLNLINISQSGYLTHRWLCSLFETFIT